jgi:hypothetical protein
MKPLPLDFVPSKDDILCGRGNDIYYHPGNLKLRTIVNRLVVDQKSVRQKAEKSHSINMVLSCLQCDNTTRPRFVKRDLDAQRYYQLDDELVVRTI